MSHTVEILSVGTELLLGNIVNSDAQALSRELSGLGLNVLYHSVVGDNPGRLEAAVGLARTPAGWAPPATTSPSRPWRRRSAGSWCSILSVPRASGASSPGWARR